MDYSRYKSILVEKSNGIAVMSLNRPDALNSFDATMHDDVVAVLGDLNKDPDVNAIVLTGKGKAFSAGGDVKMMEKMRDDASAPRITMEDARHFIHEILRVQQPIVAAVNGDALGLGATLALFCDVILMAETARIGDVHVKVGLVAGDGGTIMWPLLIGPARAKEMLLTAQLVSGRDAEKMGLVNRAVPAEKLMPEAMALATKLAKMPPQAMRWTKHCINKTIIQQVNYLLDTSLALENISSGLPEAREAVRAFLERREPNFKK